jgi:hypothetical protein
MRRIFNALVNELGYEYGSDVFAWYCRTYNVTIEDEAPAAVNYQVLGI